MGCRCGKTKKLKRRGKKDMFVAPRYTIDDVPDIMKPPRATPDPQQIHPKKNVGTYEYDPDGIVIELRNSSRILSDQ